MSDTASPFPLDLSLAIAPSSSSSANSDGGFADVGSGSGVTFGSNNIGSSGTESTAISGLVRDIATGLVVAVAAKWIWSQIK